MGLSGFKLGIDLSGGTILVYEVDQDASKLSQGGTASQGRAQADTALAESLKRRIDPADILGVVIRPLGKSRVEIILPYADRQEDGKQGAKQGEVDRVKELIKQVGSLEFRILANDTDDAEAIDAAKEYFRKADRKPEWSGSQGIGRGRQGGLAATFPKSRPE